MVFYALFKMCPLTCRDDPAHIRPKYNVNLSASVF